MNYAAMDQFKKMYRPMLKTVRPGEKRSSEERASQFDFSKRFAEMVKREMDGRLATDEISSDFKPASSIGSERVKEHTEGKIKEESETLTGLESSAPSNDEATTMQNAEFKPIGVPKLNLQRSGLLQLQSMPKEESANEPLGRSSAVESTAFTNSVLDLALSSDPLFIDETVKQDEELAAKAPNMFDDDDGLTKMFDKEGDRLAIPTDPPITATELDKG
jgi:hypothetical protein